jgi:GDPmannose 4,6-dehydratase
MSAAIICEIIERQQLNTRLIAASSSEIYKGHGSYVVKEGDTHMNHLHPYSIAKTLAHNLVKMYREKGYHFSNAVIFTTESKDKGNQFLLNKVAEHAHKCNDHKCNDHQPIQLGNLDSSRDILHVSDVANALVHIMKAELANDYLVCRNENVKIQDLVENVYRQFGIHLEKRGNQFFNGDQLVIETNPKLGCESVSHIQGLSVNLRSLGWSPKISVDQIVHEICESKK